MVPSVLMSIGHAGTNRRRVVGTGPFRGQRWLPGGCAGPGEVKSELVALPAGVTVIF